MAARSSTSRPGVRVSSSRSTRRPHVFKLPIVECDDLSSELTGLRKEAGYSLHAAVTDTDATPLGAVVPTGRDVLLFGGEAYGLGEELLKLCSQRVTIPTREELDSLNVAVASAVVMYHFSKKSSGFPLTQPPQAH